MGIESWGGAPSDTISGALALHAIWEKTMKDFTLSENNRISLHFICADIIYADKQADKQANRQTEKNPRWCKDLNDFPIS